MTAKNGLLRHTLIFLNQSTLLPMMKRNPSSHRKRRKKRKKWVSPQIKKRK